MERSDPDVAIVGGGLLGTFLACLTAEMGFRTVVFRMSDSKIPHAETLRNQGWLQTGLRYIRHDKALAEHMWTYGRRMHDFLVLKSPEGRGIIQVDASEGEAFYRDAADLGVSHSIRELPSDTARAILGPLHRIRGIAFETPESPFDEALLLREAREVARSAGAAFREIRTPVEILPFAGSAPSHRLKVDGREIAAGVTILAAGVGNIPLLKSLKSAVKLELRQTPILVIPGPPLISAPILLDRSAGLSIVAHPPGSYRDDGCMVVGTEVHDNDVPYCMPELRSISPETQEGVYKRLPDCIRDLVGMSRFTAGWEPIPFKDGKALPHVRPWIETIEGHSDVIASLPGRATLALYAAEQVLEKLPSEFKRNQRSQGADGANPWYASLPGTNWEPSAQIRMHFEKYYDGLNDGKPRDIVH